MQDCAGKNMIMVLRSKSNCVFKAAPPDVAPLQKSGPLFFCARPGLTRPFPPFTVPGVRRSSICLCVHRDKQGFRGSYPLPGVRLFSRHTLPTGLYPPFTLNPMTRAPFPGNAPSRGMCTETEMRRMNHSPTPWRVNDDGWIVDSRDFMVAEEAAFDEPADRDRAIACVNALAGLDADLSRAICKAIVAAWKARKE